MILDLKKIIILLFVFIILYILINGFQKRYTYPKICWMYWDKKKLPNMIQKIHNYNKQKLEGWDIRYLNEQSVYEYIRKEDFPSGYQKLIPAHKADWIRLQLLHKYGGCWMDASIIINDYMAMDKIYDKSVKQYVDATLFQSDKFNSSFTHISGRKIPLVIDNWYILAPKNSIIISMWLDEYTKAIRMGLPEYKKFILREKIDISKIKFMSKEDIYLTQHACIQHIFQKKITDIPNILFLNSVDDMFKLKVVCGLPKNVKKYEDNRLKCFEDKINNDKRTKKIPYIKLTRKERSIDIEKFLNNTS
jgi:hypothetical protein